MTDKIKLTDVIEQNKIVAFNGAITSLAYTDQRLSARIEEVAKLLEDLTDIRTKIAVAGDNTETAVETLWELSKLANSLLNPTVTVSGFASGGTVITGDQIVAGSITADRIRSNSIIANTLKTAIKG